MRRTELTTGVAKRLEETAEAAPESDALPRLVMLKRAWPVDRVFAERAGIDLRRLQFAGWLALTGRVSEFPAGTGRAAEAA